MIKYIFVSLMWKNFHRERFLSVLCLNPIFIYNLPRIWPLHWQWRHRASKIVETIYPDMWDNLPRAPSMESTRPLLVHVRNHGMIIIELLNNHYNLYSAIWAQTCYNFLFVKIAISLELQNLLLVPIFIKSSLKIQKLTGCWPNLVKIVILY